MKARRMDKGVCRVLLGLCFYCMVQQGTTISREALAEDHKVERLLDILKKEAFNEIKETNEDNAEDELEMRDSGHGLELDAKVLDPDSDIGHLAESFVDMYNGKAHKAKGVDPKESKIQQATNMDRHKLTREQKMGTIDGRTAKRNFYRRARPWPQGIVPYEISNVFTSNERRIIEDAIKEMNTKTCLKFQQKNPQHASQLRHRSYISIVSSGGCWSYVGRVKDGKQLLSLQKPWCVKNSITIHELNHAIGMMHEQSRKDRDKYIELYWQNAGGGGRQNGNLKKYDTFDNNPYDAESVLQYGLYSFSKNGKRTMSLKDKRLNFLPNTAKGLTFYDVWDITTFYKCTAKCGNKPVCENGGFVDHTCRCHCPDVTSGPTCQVPVTDKGCGGIVDVSRTSQVITSPNYPNNYNTNAKCVWLVKAQKGQRVNMTINDLHISDNNLNRCYHWLEVRYNLPGQTGPRECGDVTSGSYHTTPDGVGSLMILIFDSKYSSNKAASKGFSITVSPIGKAPNVSDGCTKKPCIHGTCKSTHGNGYVCTCKSGYYGKNCDQGPRLTGVLNCTFEDNSCFMKNAKNDDFDWRIRRGKTPSYGTGPSAAHSGSRYMYAEMSSPRQENERAVLESTTSLPTGDFGMLLERKEKFTIRKSKSSRLSYSFVESIPLDAESNMWRQEADVADSVVYLITSSDAFCLSMFYHMYGATVKALRVLYRAQNVPKKQLWAEIGNQGNRWLRAFIDIPYSTDIKIFIEAVRGRSWNSDIAIDDLQLRNGTCMKYTTTPPPTTPPPTTYPLTTPAPASVYTCNFERTSTCFLVDARYDQFNWSIRKGRTPSYWTGPKRAAEGSYYAYIEASSPRRRGDRAILMSKNTFPSIAYCLSFQYNMYGANMGSINVYRKGPSGKLPLWSKRGNQGDRRWRKVTVNVPAAAYSKIYIEGIRGSSFRGDAAIDDVKMKPGKC